MEVVQKGPAAAGQSQINQKCRRLFIILRFSLFFEVCLLLPLARLKPPLREPPDHFTAQDVVGITDGCRFAVFDRPQMSIFEFSGSLMIKGM